MKRALAAVVLVVLYPIITVIGWWEDLSMEDWMEVGDDRE